MSWNGDTREQEGGDVYSGVVSSDPRKLIAANSLIFDSSKSMAQNLVDHSVLQGIMTTIPEQHKEGDNRKNFWNKRMGQSSQAPSKKQQTMAVHVTTIPIVIPGTIPTIVSTTPATTSRYAGALPKCNKCNFHHTGAYKEMHYRNWNKKGHTARFSKIPAQPISQVPAMGVRQVCYACGEIGHFKRNYPNTRNVGGTGRQLFIGHEEAVEDPTMVTCTFLLNNLYACILINSGEEKSFVNQNF